MTVKPKYYFNLDGNITDGEKEYSLYNIEDVVGGLSISSGLKERYVLYGRNSLLDLLNEQHEENERLRKAVDNCQFRTLDLLDYIKEKDVVTHQEVKDWWNSEVMK